MYGCHWNSLTCLH
uniref:Uncharacterized protein n=1 Tax=Anguilla anguilla TaxID=7936 RepID=A0A0E9RGW1_ANGAN